MGTYKVFRKPFEAGDGTIWVSDLYAAAFFIARGSPCTGLKPTADSARFAFVIEPREEFGQDAADFETNGTVGIRDLQDGIQFLKALLREFARPGKSDERLR